VRGIHLGNDDTGFKFMIVRIMRTSSHTELLFLAKEFFETQCSCNFKLFGAYPF